MTPLHLYSIIIMVLLALVALVFLVLYLSTRQHFHTARQRAEQLGLIRDISKVITSTSGSTEVQFANTVYEIMRAFHSDTGVLFAVDDEIRRMTLRVFYKSNLLQEQAFHIDYAGQNIPGVDKRITVITPAEHARLSSFLEFHLFEKDAMVLCAPIVFKNQLNGLLLLSDSENTAAFSGKDISNIEAVSFLLGNLLHNYNIIAKKDRYLSKIVKVIGISHELNQSFNLHHTLRIIVREAAELANCDACSLRLLDEADKKLKIRQTYGLAEEYHSKKALAIGEGVGGTVALTGKYIEINNLKQDKRIDYTSYLENEGLQSLLSVPVKSHTRVIGILSVYSRRQRRFSQEMIDLICAFAENYAAVLEKSNLLQKIQLNYFNTMDTLINSLEARDAYTRGHSDRVTNFSLEIGREMLLSEAEMLKLNYVARLHDIGKLGVPDKILNKHGPLTVPEFAEVKLHPEKGARILEAFDFLQDTLDAIRHHHERYDGKGYPAGLSGHAIPVFARIIAVADSFDAMTSDRPYRKGLSSQHALVEIMDQKGAQFDPVIVDVFAKIIARAEREINKKRGLFDLQTGVAADVA